MKILRNISRILVGLVFIFSGFVKAVDPWGTAYKFEDYFRAMGLDFLMPAAFLLGCLMIAAEFIVGFSLLTNTKTHLGAWGALIFMSLFTPLTLWLALENPVSDCGCFGDAIKMTNWQTFYKNIVILIPTIIVFIQRKQFKSIFSSINQWIISGVGIIIVIGIMWYSYAYLPLIDFLPYKEGNHLPTLMKIPDNAPKDEYAQFITLKDTITGQEISVDVNTYTIDSTYWGSTSKYKYVSISEPKLIKKGYVPPIHDFNIFDNNNQNHIDSALAFDGFVFLLASPKLEKASNKNIDIINQLYYWTMKHHQRFYAITASTQAQIDKFIIENKIPFIFYMCDETTLKTMIRSNPGLLLLHKGTVLKKWSYNDFPTISEVEEITKLK
ncbi:MAG: DoxX family protein [Bacteroidales bacterium]|nr:DoxX family protein [Bacteroidales bacterium]